ncbi:MAG: hypothetical protein ACRDPO_08670 [Streptosporangiaceae bacterium]
MRNARPPAAFHPVPPGHTVPHRGLRRGYSRPALARAALARAVSARAAV